MRVCHVLEASGGVGNVVTDLARLGLRAGDDVTVVYAPNRATPNFVEAMTKMPKLKLIGLPMQRAVGLHDLKDAWGLYQCLRAAGPFDIINAHSSKAGALVRIMGPFLPSAVIIYTAHAFITMAPGASPVYGWIEWALSWLCKVIICGSKQEKQHALQRLKISEKKLRVIPNGVSLEDLGDRSTTRQRLGFTDKDFVVGFVGRLVPQKNPLRLATSFALAAIGRPELRLAVIGYGPLREATSEALRAQGVETRTSFHDDYKGHELMCAFDCLLCTSDYESFGLVLLEAMASGVPVVTTPVGIAEDAILQGKTGFITADFRPQSLATALVKMTSLDKAKRGQMARDAKQHAKNFSLDLMSKRTRSLYTECLSKQNGTK